jgi:hypothetical protein
MAPPSEEPCSASDTCKPNIEAADGGIALVAGAGKLSFQSSECVATDLCEMARDIEGLKAKFAKP